MPATRRSSRGTASPAGAGKQSTLSFKNKVTKSIKPVGKDTDYKSPARAKEFKRSPTPEQEQEPKSESQSESKVHDVTSGEVEQKNKLVVEQEGSKSEAEIKAAKVTDKAIEKYWGGIEASRQAKAVHRKHGEGLSTGEKVLRYFDVSSQYGVRVSLPFFLFSSFNVYGRQIC